METIINYTVGILGLILAYYFYKKSIRVKEPVYSIRSNNLISGSVSTLENLNISYKDYSVSNLTVSKMLFYNRGAETITRKDLETIHPLSISSETCKILDSTVLQVNNPSNVLKASYDEDNKNVYVEFDYLDQNQGTVIQIIHTGLSSEDLKVHGDIIGVQKLIAVSPDKFEPPPKLKAFISSVVFRIVLTFIILVIVRSDEGLKNIALVVATVLVLFTTLDVIPFIFKTMRGRILPKGLEKFNE